MPVCSVITESGEGRFFFSTELMTGDKYNVEITQNSPETQCRIENNIGIVAESVITDVVVRCRSISTTQP
jgi:hypothetical protein